VLPYVEGLADTGIRFVVLTFEKPGDLARTADVARMRARLAARHIRWVALRYHKRPSLPATAWDILCGSVVAAWLARRTGARVIHCRSYVPGLMCLLARALSGARLVFDMRGFWPEERVDGGLWAADSLVFRLAKRAERLLLRAASAVIVLTEAARRVLTGSPYRAALSPRAAVAVIPCCVDLDRFAQPNVWETAPGAAGPRTIVYAGSVGTWYMLAEMLEFYRVCRAHDPQLRFLILNRGHHDVIARTLERVRVDGVGVVAAAPEEVPTHLRRAWAGIHFINAARSRQGFCPTKLGEYLAAGLPVIVNGGVGDTDEMVVGERVGVVITRFAPDEYLGAWEALRSLAAEPGLRRRCVETARRRLALGVGVARYHAVYDALLAPARAGAAAR
jgi:glycosyltransferase involved in cell wall biosynthesis